MDFTINIAREVIGVGGHKTIEYVCKGLRRTKETADLIESMDVVRRFTDPLNASIEVVVIR